MYNLIFLLLSLVPVLLSCNDQKKPATLAESFVESFIHQDPALLEPYYPTVAFHKSLERNGSNQSDSAARRFVEESNLKLKENWAGIAERIKAGRIDPSKVEIVETILAQPFWTKKISRMVVVYSYDDKKWDDLEFIVGHSGDSTLLLEIPSPDKVFSMRDSSLQASRDARFETEIRTPEFKKSLQEKVDSLIVYAKEDRLSEFTGLVYAPVNDGPDTASFEERRRQIAAGLLEKIKTINAGCGTGEYGDVNAMDLEEGKWIILQQKCSGSFVHYAFIRVDGQLLLSDVDAAGIK